MMRKLAQIAFFLTIIFSFPLMATTTGFYLGTGMMVLGGQGNITSSGNANTIISIMYGNDFFDQSESRGIHSAATQSNHMTGAVTTKFGFTGLIGYTFKLKNPIGLGIQMDAAMGSNSTNFFKQQTSVTDIRVNFLPSNYYFRVNESYLRSYGVSLLPQWHLYPFSKDHDDWQTTLLVLLGYRYGMFKSTWDTISPLTGVVPFITRNGRNGFEFGVGAQFALTGRLDLRFIASQTWYQKKTIFGQAALGWTSKSTAQIDQATLGLIWRI